MSGTLYVVGTPIGNLGDISPRAVETLSSVDFIAAEDTRVTVRLLNHFGIKKPLVSYHDHNRFERGERILSRIVAGESCAVVSDAGMPAISDPGEDLVRLCHENGVQVVTVPGPSAVTTALALSGMDCGRFCFEGFLSVNNPGRREHLDELKNERRTMVFYEAPHKLAATLSDMYKAFGDRKIALVRELTKIHEQVIHTTLSEASEMYAETPPKGEFVLIVAGAERVAEERMTLEQAVGLAREYAGEGMSASAAAKQAAEMSGYKKSEIYRAVVGTDK
jgi:16S rRNA (cytidine1402-2'-O)-methyltransferase